MNRLQKHFIVEQPQSLKQNWLALTGLSIVFLFEMLDNSVLTVALPTIGKTLNASASSLSLATSAYSVIFGSLMLLFGSIADQFSPKKLMLSGLALLGVSSLFVLDVTNIYELIAVRALMGLAAAMTTPLTLSLTFKLFNSESLQMRAMTFISTVGLVGLSIGPTIGGAVLAVASWEFLILVNIPIAAVAFLSLYLSLPEWRNQKSIRKPLDVAGGTFGTLAIVSVLLLLDAAAQYGAISWEFWSLTASAVLFGAFFVKQEKKSQNPLIPFSLLRLPLVSSGLLYKASTSIITAGLGYVVMLQLQLDYHWSPVLAALGLLPQVITLLAVGPLVNKIVERFGNQKASLYSGLSIIVGMLVYTFGSPISYGWIAVSLILIAAGVRVNGLVAGMSVFRGLPHTHTSTGSALVDTISQICAAVSITVAGAILSAFIPANVFTGKAMESTLIHLQFHSAITVTGLLLTTAATGLFIWGVIRSKAAHQS